jgi:Kef-type K+ transport system membrane component KefB
MDALTAYVIGDVALVLFIARILGVAARRCGQPEVVGQIVAGLLLGPSFLGRLPGHLSKHLFPQSALPVMNVLSQIAIVVFMFVVGYELDRRLVRERRQVGLLVAAAAFLTPMGLGFGAVAVFRSHFAAEDQTHITASFFLFIGVAVSITALPVLAAIIRERGIAGTAAGVTATSSAGVMDAAAWLVLAAALVNTADKQNRPWWVTLLLVVGFGLFMLLAVRPALRWWMSRSRFLLANQLALALTLALGSAWATSVLSLHPVFGGFLAGLTMPSINDAPDTEVLRPMEDVAGIFLPLFFAVTGLSVNIGEMNGNAVVLLVLVIAIASVGKLIPAYLAARAGGLPSAESATVAVLVNTRGLTELIALNVGLSAKLIGDRLFSILVLMAVITTVSTAPLLRLVRAPSVDDGDRESSAISDDVSA